ncbi:MAG: TolC family protein [Acidobacteriia bacterium]|nr:TolC family protein [Terriglobia bacterium]
MRNRTRLTQHALRGLLLAAGILAGTCTGARAGQQQAPAAALAPPNPVAQPQGGATAAAPLRLSLQEALERARKYSTQFQAAATDSAIAHEDRTQARDALLPTASYNLQALYSPAFVTASGVRRFIATNGPQEYISQGNVHQVLDLAAFASFRRASAAAAAARARKEIASRGLVVTVVQGYYAVAAAQQKLEVARKSAEEGERFLKLTQDLERGGEVAHSDVIKAELQTQDRRRQLQEAQLALLNARLDLAVLLFPDFNDNYEVADDLHAAVPLPTLAEVQQLAARDNPDVRAALASVQAAGHDVTGARAGYLPSLSFDYFYGIDAAQFAAKDAAGNSNLGSAATATLSLPLWNWGATQSRIKQAELRRAQAQRELSLAQRKLLAEIRSLYAEAETALNELSGLNRSAVLAGDSLQLTMLRYKGGEATVLEVVDAQSTYSQANYAYQDGAVRYRVALANLQTLTGVLTSP